MSTLFSKIIKGEIPSHKVAEDEHYFAFLDINPLTMGHTLVVPKKETDYIFNHDAATLAGLLPFCQKVAKAIEAAVACKRIGIAVIGLEVPHTHVHLVPINEVGDINFSRQKLNPESDKLAEMAAKIRTHLSQ